jgi:hypothetical protein
LGRSAWLRRRRHEQKQVHRRLRRERRRLGRFAAFAEMEADLRPILLFDQPSSKAHEGAPPQVSASGSAAEEVRRARSLQHAGSISRHAPSTAPIAAAESRLRMNQHHIRRASPCFTGTVYRRERSDRCDALHKPGRFRSGRCSRIALLLLLRVLPRRQRRSASRAEIPSGSRPGCPWLKSRAAPMRQPALFELDGNGTAMCDRSTRVNVANSSNPVGLVRSGTHPAGPPLNVVHGNRGARDHCRNGRRIRCQPEMAIPADFIPEARSPLD